jgi:hypothetical protein
VGGASLTSRSANRSCGVQRVCRVWQVARSTIYHQSNLPAEGRARRTGSIGAASDAELISDIRDVIEAAPFPGEGYRKVWTGLRLLGLRTAERFVRRLMREQNFAPPNCPA